MIELRVRVLGNFEIEGLQPSKLGSRKGRLLVKILALARGRPVPVDRLAEWLWGDDQPACPADPLAVLASRLRKVIGNDRLSPTEGGYCLRIDWLDVLAQLVDESRRRLAAGLSGSARAAASAALDLAWGPCCPTTLTPTGRLLNGSLPNGCSPRLDGRVRRRPSRRGAASAPPFWRRAPSATTPTTRPPCAC